jgi:glucose/arabinose dehydrogenase
MRVRQLSPWAVTCALSLLCGSAGADTLEPGDPTTLFTIADYVTGLDSPTSFAFLPDGRMLITDKGGDLLIADKTGATKTVGTFAVNTVSEQGLLHVILHPSFATNRLLIFYYSASATNKDPGTDADRHRVVTVPFTATDTLDMANEKILVRGLHGPANHDGGALGIGPDGKLYIGDGDTGSNSNKPPEPVYTPTNFFATCLTYPNGKILRVNLDGSIPTDNPLVGKQVTACGANATDPTTLPLAAAREDIWAWGFRNPWRFSFDSKTGNLWVGDVGEITYEEIDVIPQTGGGKHYGWPYREGAKGHPTNVCQTITPNAGDCIDPQYYCKHGAGVTGIDGNCTAVTGGLIVDSCQFPANFQGRYFFGDSGSHWIATLQPTADRNGITAGSRQIFARSGGQPVHIDVGPDGALYYAVIAGAGTSTVERIFPKAPIACANPGTGGAPGAGGAASGGAAGSGAGAGGTGVGGTGAGATAGGGGTASGAGGTPGGGTIRGGVDASIGPDGGRAKGLGSGDTGNCGCRTAQADSRRSPALLGLALGATLIGRRRSRRGLRRG